jgi:PadR family transcriptional regulator, regulatory protein AphA
MSPMVRRPPGMELALLGFLRQGPQYGYQLHQMISDPVGLGTIWRLKQSQLYALLTKLEKDGYIWGELGAQETAHPPRRMFQLTNTGQAIYQDWLKNPVSAPRLVRQEFMAKLYFARYESQEQARALIALQRAACRKWLEAKKVEKVEPSSFNWTLHQYRLSQIEALLAWLDVCEQNFQQQNDPDKVGLD